MLQLLRRLLTGALLGAVVVAAGPGARAGDLDKIDNSLRLVPADAAFYASSLRLGEQFQAVRDSNAFKKLWDLPAVKDARAKFEAEYKNAKAPHPLAHLREVWEDKEKRAVILALGDAVSHEVFCYGDASWVGFLELLQAVSTGVQYGPAMAQLTGAAGARDQGELMAYFVFKALADHPELVRVPDTVIGFRVKDKAGARKLAELFAGAAGHAAEDVPALKGRVASKKIGAADYTVIELDGSLVPWDKVPWKDIEHKPGEFQALAGKLKALKLTVAFGLNGDYLLLSIGSGTDALRKFDAGPSSARLSSLKEVAPLEKFAGKPLLSLGYASKALTQAAVTNARDFDQLAQLAKVVLLQSGLPAEKQKAILKDLDDLIKDVKSAMPQMGAVFSFTFRSDRGEEGYTYDYSQHKGTDGSKPLTLLDHLGGNPILAAVGRSKYDPEAWATVVKWAKVIYGHADDVIRMNLPREEREKYSDFMKAVIPLLERFDEVTRKQLLPALADGQAGFVLDAKWTSKQWIKAAPETPKAMPLPELAVVVGVSDRDLLVKAMGEYRDLLNRFIALLREKGREGAIPDFKVPEPQQKKVAAGTLYFYAIPEKAGLDKQFLPTAGVADKVAVFALSNEHAERLLKATPLKLNGGPLAERANKPLASAVYFDFNALVDAVTPWIEFGVGAAVKAPPGQDREKMVKEIMSQVQVALDVLKCYKGTTSATYFEGGALVTHSESVFRDLGK
jgi:hypothetical protein